MEIINLNQDVLASLNFLSNHPPQKLDTSGFDLPFVVGSGNALNTGKILFSNQSAIYCSESNFKSVIKSYQKVIDQGLIKDTVIISASGEKDSVWEVEEAKKYGLKTTLLTCEGQSSAAMIADQVFTYAKIAEPYTYNFSTYAGMIVGATGEPVDQIIEFLLNIEFVDNFGGYDSYSFIFPDKYAEVGPMIEIKRNELFGPHLALRAFSFGNARHAGFVHPWEKELVITLGEPNLHFGHPDHRWDVQVPEFANYGLMIALSYYIVGKIQELKHPYFKNNIGNFCTDYGPKAYGTNQIFEVIVPGTNIDNSK